MNTQPLIASLECFPDVLSKTVASLSNDDARFKPADGAWSILEIVTHLADEEVEDFPARLRSTLTDPKMQWNPIDPEGWARQRNYNDGNLNEQIQRFASLRKDSITWLNSLTDPQWSNTFKHPKGEIKAGDLLAAWTAHDWLHLRQVAKRRFQLSQRDAGDYSTEYAGDWTA